MSGSKSLNCTCFHIAIVVNIHTVHQEITHKHEKEVT